MLLRLELKNFVIIKELELDFSSGFTVLTGETGAGKSIILDALELGLGGRLTTPVIYQDAERCDINLYFALDKNPAAQAWLTQQEISFESECILTRTILREGRSRQYINGQPCTLHLLNELGELLINIHGQHQHQALVKREHQRALLDAYADHPKLLASVKNHYDHWAKIKKQIESLRQQENNESHKELLRFQLEEFRKLNLNADELETLEQEHKQLAHSQQIITNCQSSLNLLKEDEHANIHSQLHQTIQFIDEIKEFHPEIQNSLALLNEAQVNLTEAIQTIGNYCEQVDTNAERLQQIEDRLAAIHQLARKHKISAQELLNHQNALEQSLQNFENADQQLKILESELKIANERYFAAAEILHNSREKAVKKLNFEVTKNIHQLGITHGHFSIDLHREEKPSVHGTDYIEFLITTNPGHPPQPLSKIASGGELSRISLAIEVVTAQKLTTPSLIFDEVDLGVGGKTGAIIGSLLQQLGKSTQVLCITHLAQVAVHAQQHFLVEKKSLAKNNVTAIIQLLNKEERVLEIARILGGMTITPQTKAHAQELLAGVTDPN